MQFQAMDTETHKGKAILITYPDSFAEPRHWQDCVDFLALYKEQICYNADYDIQAILKFLPAMHLRELGRLNNTEYGLYRLRYVSRKFFKLWYDSSLVTTIYDLKQYYASSLQKACAKYGLGSKNEIPAEWYLDMKSRLKDPATRSIVIDYALQDSRLLQSLIRKTEASFDAAGIKFEKPYSCASFAKRFFDRTKSFDLKRNFLAERMAKESYHGGLIECRMAGYFPVAYSYDIHSAYPSEMAELLLPDGLWIETELEVREDAQYAFVDATISIPQNIDVGPIPIRRKTGAIFYPSGTFRKTVTLSEYRYIQANGWISKIHAVVQHVWATGKRPFAAVETIYRERKINPAASYALKIVINALYGTMAETLTELVPTNAIDWQTEFVNGETFKAMTDVKKRTSFVYAATITANIRMRLRKIDSRKIISYSTDGILTTEPIPGLDCGPNLGQWSDPERIENLVVVGSGVYTYDIPLAAKGERETVVKFRGFSPRIDLRKLLADNADSHYIHIPVNRNTSLKLASIRDDMSEMNIIREMERTLNVNFDFKRKWDKKWNCGELLQSQFRSKPWIYYPPISMKETSAGRILKDYDFS